MRTLGVNAYSLEGRSRRRRTFAKMAAIAGGGAARREGLPAPGRAEQLSDLECWRAGATSSRSTCPTASVPGVPATYPRRHGADRRGRRAHARREASPPALAVQMASRCSDGVDAEAALTGDIETMARAARQGGVTRRKALALARRWSRRRSSTCPSSGDRETRPHSRGLHELHEGKAIRSSSCNSRLLPRSPPTSGATRCRYPI